MNLVITGLVDDFSYPAREKDGQSTINKQPKVVIVRIQRRALCVKKASPLATARRQTSSVILARKTQRRSDHCQKAFVGMKVLQVIPVHAGEPERRT